MAYIEPLNLRDAIAAEGARQSAAPQSASPALIAPEAGTSIYSQVMTDRASIGRELGVTGTTIIGGLLQDTSEYNPQLMSLQAYRVYNEMRLSDAQVQATLFAMSLPIRSCQWMVQEPDTPNAVEKEATKFIQQQLLERINLDAAISNALLMLPLGCVAHEDVYEVDGNQICLRKLAPRLPTTFYRWLTGPGDELVSIEQQGVRDGQWVVTWLPMNKCSLFTFQMEGANYAGRAILRGAYKPWYMKANLEKIDSIAIEKNGLGIPWMSVAPGAKREDLELLKEWMGKLAAHEASYIVTPDGYDFKLVGIEGQVRDAMPSIKHHNEQISMAMLATFLDLGKTQSGSRAVGATLSDFFYLATQAVAGQIGYTFTETTIKRLCQMNFAGLKRFPRLVPQEIMALKFEVVSKALSELGALVTPGEDLEDWLREKLGAPLETRPRTQPSAVSPQPSADGEEANKIQQGKTTHEKGSGKSGAPEPGPEPNPETETKVAASDLGASAVNPSPEEWQKLGLTRAPRGPEKFLALSEIVGKLDSTRDAVAAAMRDARSRVQAEIVHKLVAAPVRRIHRVAIDLDEKLVAAIRTEIEAAYAFGRDQVYAERDRQRKGAAPASAAAVRAAFAEPDDDPLGVYAEGAVSKYSNNLTARAANAVLDLRKQNTTGAMTEGEIIRAAEDELDSQSDKWIDGVASEASNEAFGDGRELGYEELKDEIGEVQYSSLLDGNTCEACQEADGQSGAAEDDVTDAPNPDCDGGDRCRCVHVYVFSDEGKAA